MKWQKMGRIFAPGDFNSDFIKSHAQIPTVLVAKDLLRIYFATRPKPGLSLTTFIDVDIRNPKKIVHVNNHQILNLGEPGKFDEDGVMPSSVINMGNEIWMYYGGWSRRSSIPYSNWTGLAISKDGGDSFHKQFNAPIIDRTINEHFSATGFFALKYLDNFYAWYASGTKWIMKDSRYEEVYTIKAAVSQDAIQWQRDGSEIFPVRGSEVQAIHRPTVIKKNDIWHMWFCYRGVEDFRDGGDSYRIGYAWSKDLAIWNREDEKSGIDVSASGWDSKMIAYPYVVDTDHGTYMFYNGNGFGQSGFGYAILEEL